MGNQTAKQQVQRLSEINLTEAEQQQMEELLWQVDYPKFKQDYNAFLKKYNLNFDLKEMFTVHSTYEDDDSGQSKNESKTLLNEVVQKMTYGFTSSEYKLNELQKGGKHQPITSAHSLLTSSSLSPQDQNSLILLYLFVQNSAILSSQGLAAPKSIRKWCSRRMLYY